MRYLKCFVLLFVVIQLVSCGDHKKIIYPEYSLTTYRCVPDSNKVKMSEWITKTVESASKHLTTSDYEDPEDLIEECTDQARTIFETTQYGLYKRPSKNEPIELVRQNEMNKSEKKILDSLINL